MCVKTVTSLTDASNSGEDAPSIETSTKSGQRLKLLCSPLNLPETKLPKTEEYRETDKYKQAELKDYFWTAGFRRFHARRAN